MQWGTEPLEKIIHLKDMKEWLFFSTEKEFKIGIFHNTNLIEEVLEGEMRENEKVK